MIENLGVGIDIIDVNKFRDMPYQKKSSFYKRIFHENEINYCLNFKDPYTHFAGKFAAKEAIIKATQKKIKLNQIEIKNNKKGLEVIIKNNVEVNILVSISHEKDYAVAMSVIETIIKNRF